MPEAPGTGVFREDPITAGMASDVRAQLDSAALQRLRDGEPYVSDAWSLAPHNSVAWLRRAVALPPHLGTLEAVNTVCASTPLRVMLICMRAALHRYASPRWERRSRVPTSRQGIAERDGVWRSGSI
jgi:hypothetical protein